MIESIHRIGDSERVAAPERRRESRLKPVRQAVGEHPVFDGSASASEGVGGSRNVLSRVRREGWVTEGRRGWGTGCRGGETTGSSHARETDAYSAPASSLRTHVRA